jgi:hypothetical protein
MGGADIRDHGHRAAGRISSHTGLAGTGRAGAGGAVVGG